MTSYYRRIIRGFVRIAGPLHELTSVKVPFVWSSKADDAFGGLKASFLSPPILALPDISKLFTVYEDASGYVVGEILAQVGEYGKEHPTDFASRTLQSAERE